MTVRHRIYTALAGIHLMLVVCGALGWNILPQESVPGRALQAVRGYTGSDTGFGFFAPGVPGQIRAKFYMRDANGKEWSDFLDSNMTREAKLRAGSGVGLADEIEEGKFKTDFAKSWAATMFGRYPTAKTVFVEMEYYDPPSMEEYRNGKRPEWKAFWGNEYKRNEKGTPSFTLDLP
jgi:hypothetical protein